MAGRCADATHGQDGTAAMHFYATTKGARMVRKRIMPQIFKTKPNQKDKAIYAELVADFEKREGLHRKDGPYVLFGHLSRERDPQSGDSCFVPQLHKLPIGNMHGSITDLKRYLDRNFVILKYWIPKPEQIPAPSIREGMKVDSGWPMEMRSAEGQDRLRKTEALIRKIMREDELDADLVESKFAEKDAEIAALKAKLADQNVRVKAQAQVVAEPQEEILEVKPKPDGITRGRK